MTAAELMEVPVAGGRLTVGAWGPAEGPVVVAAHGITSSHVFWTLVGEELAADGIRLVAPDLRGRGLSADLPGPSSIPRHAGDLMAVLDHLGVQRALVVGHSMGGFVAAVAAVGHPDRVAATLLVDGGPPLSEPLGPDTDVQAALHAIIGPSLERLRQTFASRAVYRAFWHSHPAFAAVPAWLVDAYADHDLVAADRGGWRSRVVEARIVEDARGTLTDPQVYTAVDRIDGPVAMLYAPRGILDGPTGLYPSEVVQAACARQPRLETAVVPDTNHFTIGMSPHGAEAVASAILDLLEQHT
ncbi:MAG TPA: alpha/beta hydrolase [Euzebya sp.]|nr:alpha/beta hydrolase [Euzebya sp.]